MASSRLSVSNYTDDLIAKCIRVLQSRRYAMNPYPETESELNQEIHHTNPIIIITPPTPTSEAEDNDCDAASTSVQYAINIAPQQSEDITTSSDSAVVVDLDGQHGQQEGTLAEAGLTGDGIKDGGAEAGNGEAENGDGGAGAGPRSYNYQLQQIMPMDIDEYEEALGRSKCVDMCVGIMAFALLIGFLILKSL